MKADAEPHASYDYQRRLMPLSHETPGKYAVRLVRHPMYPEVLSALVHLEQTPPNYESNLELNLIGEDVGTYVTTSQGRSARMKTLSTLAADPDALAFTPGGSFDWDALDLATDEEVRLRRALPGAFQPSPHLITRSNPRPLGFIAA